MTSNPDIADFPKTKLAFTPTPFYKLKNISDDLNCNLYCKRDDLTGFAFGGNKVRKMEYLIADVIEKQADTIVTSGAYQSNFCRITAAAGAYAQLDVQVVLGGRKEPTMTGNYLLTHHLGARIHHVKSDRWEDWEAERQALSDSLRKEGRVVYEMPIGGSVPLGALGYVAAFYELLDDFKRLDINPTNIFFASSSGGTQAGLLVGKWLTGWKGTVTGIGTAKSGGALSDEISTIAKETAALFGITASPEDIIVDDSHVGEAYGIPTKECEEAIQYFAQKEGVFLDRVYSGKAAAGVLDYIKTDKVSRGEAVVFIHTGGNVELFA
jgi:D-cysteine desulfhydrase family pyridoxal phosphate-dependent enzyme